MGNPPRQSPPANRVVERDPYSRKYKLYHANDVGDVLEFVFYLPKGTRMELVEKAFLQKGRRWIEWRAKRGFRMNTKVPVGTNGPFQPLEFDHLHQDAYVITARFFTENPEEVNSEEGERMLTNQPDRTSPGGVVSMFRQAANLPDHYMSNLKNAQRATEKAGLFRKQIEHQEKERRERRPIPFRP